MTGRAKKETSVAGGADDGLDFDQRLERLEAIVAELEGGGLGLEEAMTRYQEGIGHLKRCHGRLSQVRQRVEELTAGAEGALGPFDGDPDFDSSASS